jgi:hypothetical protein
MHRTSFATPLVAGVCALIRQAHPDWTPHQVRIALLATASNAAAPDNACGWGIVNATAAVDYDLFNQAPAHIPKARGVCNTHTGQCSCSPKYYGSYCAYKRRMSSIDYRHSLSHALTVCVCVSVSFDTQYHAKTLASVASALHTLNPQAISARCSHKTRFVCAKRSGKATFAIRSTAAVCYSIANRV